jgi:hypothetical protein
VEGGGIISYIQYNEKRFGLVDRSAAGLAQPRLRFNPTLVHLRFVVDKKESKIVEGNLETIGETTFVASVMA